MTIGEIITKYYKEFHDMVRNPEVAIENGNTSEDIFENAILTALKKYKDKDVAEQEGYEYVKKTLLTEFHFCWKRKGRDILVFNDLNTDSIKSV